eukprot:TRINITY_DN5064_c0_g1_i3.p1 TRINITY_DN5064_c0_g1~~TRINITY_DN5064_c0_g1_i3.p1  ORF type:complete len:205 (+),score=59.14 TRINITY_DN5064_c0_g1_i3:57-671(+)
MDTKRQIEQMKQFILSEAEEKAQEITTKARNEAEASKLENSKKQEEEIDRQCAKELETSRIELRVAHANKLKAMRGTILVERNEAVEELRKNTSDALKKLAGSGDYQKLFNNLFNEAIKAVTMDGVKTATVKVKKDDVGIAKTACKNEKNLTIEVDSENLPDSCLGGCILSARKDTVVCNNTLSHRLENCMEELMPMIRDGLFK